MKKKVRITRRRQDKQAINRFYSLSGMDYNVANVGILINPHFYANRNANLKGRIFDTEGLKAVKPPDGNNNIGSNGLDKKLRKTGIAKDAPDAVVISAIEAM